MNEAFSQKTAEIQGDYLKEMREIREAREKPGEKKELTAEEKKTGKEFLKELEGGCQVPIGAFGRLKSEILHIEGMVAETDGSRVIRDSITGEKDRPEEAGIRLARRLLNSGADRILSCIYGREI